MRAIATPVVLTVLLLMGACRNGLVEPLDPAGTVTVKTTIGGMVVDESGSPMAGVSVSAHGSTTITNANGIFQFKSISVPSERACVIARTNGYFNAAHAEWPSPNGVTLVQLTMQKAVLTTAFSAASSQTVQLGSSSIVFPANGYVTTNGSSYKGTVSVSAAYLTPDEPNTFERFFAGDAVGRSANDSSVILTSYGVLRVQITGAQGEQLELKTGSTASLRFPLPKSMPSPQLSGIPLWYFDEQIGMWKEEGSASLVNGVYVGNVSHFTDWNLDVPSSRRAFVEGRVLCAANRPVQHVWVRLGQVSTMTDENGYFKRAVAVNTPITIEVDTTRNRGIGSTKSEVIELEDNQTRRVEITVSPCPTELEGTLVDCDNKAIAGFIQVESSSGFYLASTSDGSFSMTVPSEEDLSIVAVSIDGRSSSKRTVPAINRGALFNIGEVRSCDSPPTSFIEIPVEDSPYFGGSLTFIDNDETLVLFQPPSVSFYSARTGALIRTIGVESSDFNVMNQRIGFSADESVMMLGGFNAYTQTYETSTGKRLARVSQKGDGFLTADGKHIIQRDSTGEYYRRSAVTGMIEKVYNIPNWGVVNFPYYPTTSMLGLQYGGDRIVYHQRIFDTITANYSIVVWDADKDAVVHSVDLLPCFEDFKVLSRDGTIVYTRGYSSKTSGIDCYDLVRGVSVSGIELPRDPDNPYIPTIAISPDKRTIATFFMIDQIRYIALRSTRDYSIFKLISFKDEVNGNYSAATFDSRGTHLATKLRKKSGTVVRIYTL